MKTILITGAGSGFGAETALRLAAQEEDVIAAAQVPPQIHALEKEAQHRGVKLRIETLDVTCEGDRKKAEHWDVSVLLNNADISEGGAVADIPAENLRRQCEVNIIGPFLTGFNDRMFETWKGWCDDPSERVFDYSRIAFPHEQYDPEPVIETTIGVLTGKIGTYRNVEPQAIIGQQRQMMDKVWTRKSAEGLGQRAELVKKAYELKPGTPV